MSYQVFFLQAAKLDLDAVFNWYEIEKPGLGTAFLKAAVGVAEQLAVGVITHRFYLRPVRYVKMKQFPYSLFYIKDEAVKSIVVIAVLANKQDMLHIIQNRPQH